MRTVGIIAEFNPFHKGHQYILEKAKAHTDCQRAMVVMSGSVGIPSERSIFRNSFIPLISKLHSKSVSFSFVFLLNIKMTSLYLVIPFYKEVCVLSNVWNILL